MGPRLSTPRLNALATGCVGAFLVTMFGVSTRHPPPSPSRPRWVIRLAANLNRWQRPVADQRDLEPTLAGQELLAWSQDDGRWIPKARRDWESLLDDVDASWSRLGPSLMQVAAVADQLAALRDVRTGGVMTVPDHRSTVDRAARALKTAFDAPDALIAAVDDLFAAAQRSNHPDSLDDDSRWRLALVASVGERHGHDWAVVAERVRGALEATAARPPSESIDAVHRALHGPADHGHSIVWLAVDQAWVWGLSPNPAIQLLNGDWLLAVLRSWDGPREGVPAELAADPQRLLRACPRFDEDADSDEQLPVTFARIDLGEGPTVGARDRARDTLELLIAQASARQGGTNWKVSGVCLHFVDGELIFESVGPIGDPDIYDRLTRADITRDPTGTTIKEEAERLRPRLPVTDDRLHAALQLAEWLTQARGSSPPARLVLSGRIIEQAANWASVSVPELVKDHLALAWAWKRIAGDLARAGAAAVLRLPGAHGTSSTDEDRRMFLNLNREVIDDRHGGWPPRARPWEVLRRLDWLVTQHGADTEIGDYLRELQSCLGRGPATAAWIDGLCRDLRVRNARAVRTRNVIVHGGPLITGVAETVVRVQDTLASQALEWVIDALANERAPHEVFAEHRARYIRALERMRGGADPTREVIAGAG